jgi:hypothetical protein
MVLLASDYDKSRFLKADDFEGDRKLRIKNATEEVIGVGTEKEKKLVVWFTNDDRGLVLNKTNNRAIRGAFGDAVDGWTGKVVIVFPKPVDVRGSMKMGLRVRIPPPKNGKAAAPVAPRPKPPVDEEIDDFDEPPAQSQTTATNDFDDEIGL